MSISEVMRRRRIVHRQRETLRANDALFTVARQFRRQAQAEVNAGHPELAEPFLAEAELFESAAQAVRGL